MKKLREQVKSISKILEEMEGIISGRLMAHADGSVTEVKNDKKIK